MYRKGEVFWDRGEPSPPMKEYLERHAVRGRALAPGCGRGHEVALAVEHGLDAIGLDIAPTGVAEARARYPHLAERFVTGNLFDPPEEMRGAFDVVLEHTCMSALPRTLRKLKSGLPMVNAAAGPAPSGSTVYSLPLRVMVEFPSPYTLKSYDLGRASSLNNS